ncbi:MAG TPA: nucleotide 5'-monophosphate nucleosidase PpnN [Steroidobacteraceae bacterium]|nr:nucleotide 5'-monophosphate nucleosidase PpnN [Steroidobacteraceae bacterium]
METSIVVPESVDARVGPRGSLEILSQAEIDKLLDTSQTGLHTLFRNCALAVLNSGSDNDNAKDLFERYRNFDVRIVRHAWGIKLEMTNAPPRAFVDGEMIRGIKEHLFAVLRDIIYTANEIIGAGRLDGHDSASITNSIFHILRNARLLDFNSRANLVVCWGGHSIGPVEYDYAKRVGYEMGLRALDVCTGCGPGAMKAPMKGAGVGHAKQRITEGRFVGVTEPGIIAAEPPNAIVNQLVIMPDIEKRLEAFLRLAHGIVIFPGGAGTAEEILYVLGVLLDPANSEQPLPVVLTGPRESAAYFEQIAHFVENTLGAEALTRLKVIIDDPAGVARHLVKSFKQVRSYRRDHNDSYTYNWLMRVPYDLQQPFEVTHASMRALRLQRDQPVHLLAANLRRAFSGIVTGNVKEFGVAAIEKFGPYELSGDAEMMRLLDDLLTAFIAQGRMKLPGTAYRPCYRLVA